MSGIVTLMKKLPMLLPLKPATEAAVSDIEIDLALPLAEEYKEYVLAFGAIMADGLELTGVAKSKHRDVVQVTQNEWAANPKISNKLYVVENVGIDGLVIWQDGSGKIYESRPSQEAKKIADSLEAYLQEKYNL